MGCARSSCTSAALERATGGPLTRYQAPPVVTPSTASCPLAWAMEGQAAHCPPRPAVPASVLQRASAPPNPERLPLVDVDVTKTKRPPSGRSRPASPASAPASPSLPLSAGATAL